MARLGTKFRQRTEPNGAVRRRRDSGTFNAMYLLWDRKILLKATQQQRQTCDTVDCMPRPASPATNGSHSQSRQTPEQTEQRRGENHADQPFDHDEESAADKQHICRCSRPEVIRPTPALSALRKIYSQSAD